MSLVLLEKRDGYAFVTLNRPDEMNALSRELRRQFVAAFEDCRTDDNVRVIILTGNGRAFCAGFDLKELGSNNSDNAANEVNNALAWAMAAFEGPIIGAINGHAITGGFEMALACDVLIASENARFADTHARVGILPGWGLSQKLPRLIGLSRAKEISFTGAPVFAQQPTDDPVRWYHLAAEQGHVDAQFSLGMRYLEGNGVEADVGEAQRWLEAAALQGHAEAQFQLANLLSKDTTPGTVPTHAAAPKIAAAPALDLSPATAAGSNIAAGDLQQCAFQKPPALIDGQWAGRREMRKLDEDIRTYVAVMQASFACIDRLLERQLTETDRQMLDSFYNNGVDQLNFIVDEYNQQVREFRIADRLPDLDTSQQ